MLKVTDVSGRHKTGFFLFDLSSEKKGVLLLHSTNLEEVVEYIKDFHPEIFEACAHCSRQSFPTAECELKIELPSRDKNEFWEFLSSMYYEENISLEVRDEY